MVRCAECGFDWETEAAGIVRVISRFGQQYRERVTAFDLLAVGRDGRDMVRIRPAPAVWSALEYAAHMRDVLAFYFDRIDRALCEDRPTMTAADFASMAESRRYQDEDVDSVLDAVDRRGSMTARRLRLLGPADWLRVGIGSEGGERTVLTLARRLAHDGHHHLMDLDRLYSTVGRQ